MKIKYKKIKFKVGDKVIITNPSIFKFKDVKIGQVARIKEIEYRKFFEGHKFMFLLNVSDKWVFFDYELEKYED